MASLLHPPYIHVFALRLQFSSLKRGINLFFHSLNLAWLHAMLWTIECGRSERMSLPTSSVMTPVLYLALLHLCHHHENKARLA